MAQLLDDFAKRGEAEVVYLRKDRERWGKSWQLVGVEDCMHRSRHHSRYAIFQDLDERILSLENQTLAQYVMKAMTERPNIGMLQFRSTWVVCTKKPPDKYEGEEALRNHLPTLVYDKSSDVEPPGSMAKCVVDTRRVLLFVVHAVYVYFPGYESACAPPDRAIIRHYRDLTFNDRRTKKMRGYPGYAPWLTKITNGNFTITHYPSNLMKQLYPRIKKRLERVYR
ncbi:unnamed protein product [Cylicocyclus nassatus]|uniref:Glycosyltransferase family 92 protein n=1 Tax=Cylicocyclus nassatus TaxID=53992 RepID=A0AA36MGA7_CYLNA|nr:unnamed protein product [Cylicocyclus nassatus]